MPLRPPALDDRSFDDLVATGRKLGNASPEFAEPWNPIPMHQANFGTQVGSEGIVASDVDHVDDGRWGGGEDFF